MELRRWFAASVLGVVLSGTLALVVPGAVKLASAQTRPSSCPAGSTLNPATNTCEDGTVCPPGVAFSGGACNGLAVDFCPAGAGGTAGIAPNPFPPPAFICFGPPPPAAADCPAGTTFTPGPGVTGLDSTCSGAPAACPGNLVANAAGLCVAAPTCAAGEQFVSQLGLCFPAGGTTGPAFANGGNGGSARGGDGGRGGDGFAPQCNQNSNDVIWDFADQPTVACGAGGSGGDAGDGGISEGGNGGLAFTDGFA